MPNIQFFGNGPIVPGDQQYLERPQIDRLLEKAVKCPLVTIVAGAGYGKTCAVYSFLQKHNMVAAWIQLSERDNIGTRFWENFTRTIGLISQTTAKKLREIGFPETKRQFDRYLVIPGDDILRDKKYVFVYDDFHLIHDPSVLRFIERSVSTSFPNITSLIISRVDPPINTLPFLSKGLLVSLTEDELRFSRREMTDYFAMRNIRLSPEDTAGIYHDTEGWAFAINLAGMSLKQGVSSVEHVRSSIRINVFNLIEEEIFSVISPSLQRFLVKLSFIDYLPPPLLNELAEDKDLPEEMKRISTFIRFDTYLNAYRIHHLFLRFLAAKQDILSEEEKRAVYTMAARWCAENNLKTDAISYYEKAGRYDELIDLVYTLNMAMSDTITKFVLDILSRAPREIYMKVPAAYILYTRTLLTLGRFEEAEAELRARIEEFEALPSSTFNNRVLCGLYINLGFTIMMTAHHTKRYNAEMYFRKSAHFASLCGRILKGAVRSLSLSSYACLVKSEEKGEIEKYIDATTATVPYMVAAINGCGYGRDDLARAEFAYYRGDIDNAERFALESLYKAQKRNQYEIENRSIFYLLRAAIAQGDGEKVRELFRLLNAQLEKQEFLNRYIFYDIVSGWFYAQTGAAEKIASWLKNDFEESELNSLMHGLETLVRIKAYQAEKKYSEALSFFAALGDEKDRRGMGAFLFGRIGRKTITAVCLFRTGDENSAIRALEGAYVLAEPNALEMPFIELGKDMYDLIGAALKTSCSIPQPWLEKIRNMSAVYAKKLLLTVEQLGQNLSPGIILNTREKRILHSLSQGLTREEIARENRLTLGVVKAYIGGLYQKLGAINRANAVRIATSLGLLKQQDGRERGRTTPGG
ncbi:MAG: LuxR C-terminal-related transcriptional regulator [Treponema sp.]|jgi:LuxR family maltose regulon positive regulatory protein|nr:LuxR C-terminal-related transcriptional regulator [Treponema sp.]